MVIWANEDFYKIQDKVKQFKTMGSTHDTSQQSTRREGVFNYPEASGRQDAEDGSLRRESL